MRTKDAMTLSKIDFQKLLFPDWIPHCVRGKKAPRESSSRLVCLYHHRINKVVSPTVGYLPPNCRAEITSTSDLDNHYYAHNQSKKLLSYFTTMFGMKESIDTAVRHYKEGNLNWPMIIYISLAHAAAIIGLFSLSQCHKYTLLWAFVLWPIRLVKVNMNRKERWNQTSLTAVSPLISLPVVESESLEASTDFGRTDLTRPHILSDFGSCFPTQLPTKEVSGIGRGITEFTTSTLR